MRTFIANGPGGQMFPKNARKTVRGNSEVSQARFDALKAKVDQAAQSQRNSNLKETIAQEVAAEVARLRTQIDQLKGSQAMAERDGNGLTVHCDITSELPGGDD